MSRENKSKRHGANRGDTQTDKPVGAAERHGRSNPQQEQTRGWPSDPQEDLRNPGIEGDYGGKPGQESKPSRDTEKNFNILVDNVPYIVTATRFTFNGEVRYKVSFNGSSEHVFTWDSSLGQLRAIDDEASTMPDNLEIAISEKLQTGI
jgi:hypothetical protein